MQIDSSTNIEDDISSFSPIEFEPNSAVDLMMAERVLVVRAPSITINEGVAFVGNGTDGAAGRSASPQTAKVADTKKGREGRDGVHGDDGGHGKGIIFIADKFSATSVTFILSGGNGGRGGNGGKGGSGGRADRSKGKPGGQGGRGGNGADGGDGGDGGFVVVISPQFEPSSLNTFIVKGGQKGVKGKRGGGGAGGAGRGEVFLGLGAQPGGPDGLSGKRDGSDGKTGGDGIAGWVHFNSIEEVKEYRPDWFEFLNGYLEEEKLRGSREVM